MFFKKGVLRNFRKINRKTPVPESLFKIKLQADACNFIKRETLAQVFSCEFCEISKNNFSYRTPPMAASELMVTFAVQSSFLRKFVADISQRSLADLEVQP